MKLWTAVASVARHRFFDGAERKVELPTSESAVAANALPAQSKVSADMDCGGKRSATPLSDGAERRVELPTSESAVAANALPAQSKVSIHMDCGGKRSATPLSRPKAPSPLRSAGAVQNALEQDGGCSPALGSRTRRRLMAVWLGVLVLLPSGIGLDAVAAETRSSAGITEPIADVILSASVPGIVSEWKFKEGDFVKENDTILKLDCRLEELEVERRKAVMENRKSDLDSLQMLASRSSISVKKEDVEKAETEYRIARAEHDMAQEQLNRRRVISPISGTIVEIARDVGEACQAYQALIRVVDTRRCYFVSNVEAKLAAGLRTGQEIRLEIDGENAPPLLRGTISYLSPVVDPASGLQRVKVVFDNSGGGVRPGVAGRMLIE